MTQSHRLLSIAGMLLVVLGLSFPRDLLGTEASLPSTPAVMLPPAGGLLGDDIEHVRSTGFPTLGGSAAITTDKSYVYVGSGAQVGVIATTSPNNPALLGMTSPLTDSLRALAIQGGSLYVAAGKAGLHIYDLSNPAAPRHIGVLALPGETTSIAVGGRYAYVAANSRLHIVDVADPAAPRVVTVYEPSYYITEFVLAGSLILVPVREAGLRLVDIADPMAPRDAGSWSGVATDVVVRGTLAYVLGSGLRTLDISRPAEPHEIAMLPSVYGDGLAIDGDTLVIFHQVSGLQVFNLSNPAQPLLVSDYGFVRALRPRGLAIVAGFAYFSTGAGVEVFDLTDPVRPARVALNTGEPWYAASRYAGRVVLSGNHAYVARYAPRVDSRRPWSRLSIFELTDPHAPREAGGFDVPERTIRDL